MGNLIATSSYVARPLGKSAAPRGWFWRRVKWDGQYRPMAVELHPRDDRRSGGRASVQRLLQVLSAGRHGFQ